MFGSALLLAFPLCRDGWHAVGLPGSPPSLSSKDLGWISLPREMSSLLRVSGRAFPTFKDHLSPLVPLPPAVSPLLPLALQLSREQSWGGSSGVGGLSSVI